MWLERQPQGVYLAIVGGGEAIEAMRTLDRLHHLDQTEMHWRCITMLDATFEIAFEILRIAVPSLRVIQSYDQLQLFREMLHKEHSTGKQLILVRVKSFYDQLAVTAPREKPLVPEIGWQTTSDTLAMYLAHMTDSKRCVLLKSCSVDGQATLDDAVAEGMIDAQVIKYAAEDIRCELITL